jgi:hypothetical protein
MPAYHRAVGLRRPRSIATLAVAIVAISVAGCGGSGDASPSPERYLLTTAGIDQIASGTENPAAVRSVLEFWRAIQFQSYGDAYNLLAKPIRSHVSYEEFISKLGPSRYLFLARPQVYDLQGKDPVTVFLVAPQGDRLTDNDQVIGFTATREGGAWRVGSDPFNILHEPTTP